MKLLKPITGVLFVLLALLPVVISLLFLKQQHDIRETMERALEQEDLVMLRLPVKELVWHKKGKEIVVGGHLFDVHSISLAKEGMVEVTGLFDHQEQALYGKLNHLLSHKSKSLPAFNGFQKWISVLYHDHFSQQPFLSPPTVAGSVLLLNFNVQLPPAFLPVDFPPPRYIT